MSVGQREELQAGPTKTASKGFSTTIFSGLPLARPSTESFESVLLKVEAREIENGPVFAQVLLPIPRTYFEGPKTPAALLVTNDRSAQLRVGKALVSERPWVREATGVKAP